MVGRYSLRETAGSALFYLYSTSPLAGGNFHRPPADELIVDPIHLSEDKLDIIGLRPYEELKGDQLPIVSPDHGCSPSTCKPRRQLDRIPQVLIPLLTAPLRIGWAGRLSPLLWLCATPESTR